VEIQASELSHTHLNDRFAPEAVLPWSRAIHHPSFRNVSILRDPRYRHGQSENHATIHFESSGPETRIGQSIGPGPEKFVDQIWDVAFGPEILDAKMRMGIQRFGAGG
jgi:hypothetical protein